MLWIEPAREKAPAYPPGWFQADIRQCHQPHSIQSIQGTFTVFPWKTICAEVLKLEVQRDERGQLARLSLAASDEKENPGSPDGGQGLATSRGRRVGYT
jgi:hypothetical protein